jgi:hypothetical protein
MPTVTNNRRVTRSVVSGASGAWGASGACGAESMDIVISPGRAVLLPSGYSMGNSEYWNLSNHRPAG